MLFCYVCIPYSLLLPHAPHPRCFRSAYIYIPSFGRRHLFVHPRQCPVLCPFVVIIIVVFMPPNYSYRRNSNAGRAACMPPRPGGPNTPPLKYHVLASVNFRETRLAPIFTKRSQCYFLHIFSGNVSAVLHEKVKSVPFFTIKAVSAVLHECTATVRQKLKICLLYAYILRPPWLTW